MLLHQVGGEHNAGIGTDYDYHLCYLLNYVCDKQFEGRQEVMAICNGKNYIPEDGLDGMCIADKCENIAICLRHKYYDIHRKIAEAGKAPPIKRRPKSKMNELFATSPNDNSCRSFHPEANCPYPLCDNMECEKKDDCCIHTDYEVKHGPYGQY